MNVIANVSVTQALVIFICDLLLPEAVIGSLAGWLIIERHVLLST
jgi:hypothetical protein